MPELRELTGDAAWERALPILRQLWSHRSEDDVRSWRDDGDYRLFGLFVDDPGDTDGSESPGGPDRTGGPGCSGGPNDTGGDALVAVAGVYVQTVLHHERSLWIHDFVVDESARGDGYGEALLRELEAWGAEQDCDHVALVCAADNEEAAGFYEHEGMEPFGTVYEVEL